MASVAPSLPPARLHDNRRVVFALHATLVVALATWVRSLTAPAGVAAGVGLVIAAGIAWRGGRRLAALGLAAIGVASAMLVASHARTRHSVLEFAAVADGAERALPYERSLADAIRQSQSALAASATTAAAGVPVGDALPELRSDAGVVVYLAGAPVAWAGRTVVPTDRLWERSGIVTTPLYVVQYATAVHDDWRAVATNVVSAVPPADHLTRSLAAVAAEAGLAGFEVTPIALTQAATGTYVDVGGARLAIRARTPDADRLLAQADERARTRGTALLALATLVALATLWRRAERLPERLAAAALPLAALAITPLNALSNVTRLFDPATYYVAGGGPFTSSVGALALTSALTLFVVLAALRSRARPRRRVPAMLTVLFIAGLGPFLLRDLARGVALPPNGASTGLWLAWEVALFLAATSLLAAGVTAGQWAFGPGRGLPLWIAPVLAAVAALLAPALLQSAAHWPSWYPALWVAAIAALALTRRSRVVILPSAFVAACGATVLLWGATLRERVELATTDVSGLATIDTTAASLLVRLADDLGRGPVPRDRAQLLTRYAASDIAAVDYPVSLAHWPVAGGPDVLRIGADARLIDLAPIVAAARETDAPQLHPIAPAPASALALAVPHPNGEVTSIVVGAHTRLTPALTFAELLGLSVATTSPPYQIAVAEAASVRDTASGRWIRRGNRLHSDWAFLSSDGRVAHVYADVPFDSYGSLLPRGMLIVLLDVFIVLAMLGADALADGALLRWVRARRKRWTRSYRLQLTVALFAFFFVPALAFALWSYRELQTDDQTARQLLVRETLRHVAIRPSDPNAAPPRSDELVSNVPGDVPYFVYRRGQLAGASDTLLVSLAPVGGWLAPDIKRVLANGEDLVVTAVVPVAGRPTLFGFRQLAPDFVVAVPARHDDAALDKRRSDLGVMLLLSTVLGALAALWLSGVAARQLARPIGTLRGAALAVAGGSRAPLHARETPAEFVPVFQAFDRMARDLASSEAQLSHAERVFAWGEMARQVAHEIKNPLTPIRLGVQHMLRAWRDKRPDFGGILEENSARVLSEIDHLDATARSFSQYGTAPGEPEALETVDVAAVVRDVAALEKLGADGLEWRTVGAVTPCWARARGSELREVLLNLCENSRLAGARSVALSVGRDDGRVLLSVVDDGEGVAPDVRARVFDPHFSTRTSGSGLGLAISRRLVASWGGSIDLSSESAAGTTVRLQLVSAEPPRA